MKKKRLLPALLALCMVIGLLPATHAAETIPPIPESTNPATTWFKDQLSENSMAQRLYNTFKSLSEMSDFTAGTASIDLIATGAISAAELSAYMGGNSALAKAFQDARDAFFQDHPEFFYIDTTKLTLRVGKKENSENVAYISNGPNASYLDSHYADQAAVKSAITAVDEKKNTIVAEIEAKKNEVESTADGTNSGALSTAEIVTLVHNKVVELFNYKYPSETVEQVIGVSSLTTEVANCQGYSKTVKWILDALKIPCVLVGGAAQNSNKVIEEHMWNYVRVDGTWYAVDATWDDPVTASKALRYTYLLQGGGLMAANHAPSGQFSPGGMTFTYPEISDLSYDVAISAVLNDLDSDLKVYTERVIYEDVESTRYMITYKGDELAGVMGNNPKFYLAGRFAYADRSTGELKKFKPWVDMSAYALNWDEAHKFLWLAFTQPGSIQFCITDRPMGKDENGKSRLCYADDLSLEGNHEAISKPLLVPYYSDYIAPPYVRLATPALTQRIAPVKTHFRVEYTEALEIIDPTKPIGFTITNTSDLTGTEDKTVVASVENLTIAASSYTTPDGETHQSSILEFDFIPDKTYQGYSVYYSLYPTNLTGAVSKKAPNPIGISTTFEMKIPCPLAGSMPGPHDAFVVAYPKLIAGNSSDAFVEAGTNKPANSMDIRLVATIPDKDVEEGMLGVLNNDNIQASSVYEMFLGCKSALANLRPGSGIFDVTVGLPYPPGFNYKENSKVTFKAYHYIEQEDGSYKTEELVCRITELGLEVIVNGFSPFAVVAVPKEADAPATNKLVSLSQKTSGGKITITEKNPDKPGEMITVSAAGLYALKAGDSRTFTLVPDAGYEVDKVLLNGAPVSATTAVTFAFDSMADENNLDVFFIAKTVKTAETESAITAVVPKLKPVALGNVEVTLTEGDGKLTLAKPTQPGTYYYKTSLTTELGAKPTVGDKVDGGKWIALTAATDLPLDSGMEFFVQVIRVENDVITAWGQASGTPRRVMETLTPKVTAAGDKLTLAGPIVGDAAEYYYRHSAAQGSAPALDSEVDTAVWTKMESGKNVSMSWGDKVSYVGLIKAKDGKVLGWGETFVEGKTAVTPPSGGGGGGSTSTPAPSVPVADGTAAVTATAKVSGGAATVELKDADITAAIAQLKKADVKAGSITVTVEAPKAERLSATIPAKVQSALLDGGIASLSIESPLMTLTLNRAALMALQSKPTHAVKLDLVPGVVNDLAVGDRPAYEVTATVDGKEVVDFGAGRLTLTIPYKVATTEDTASLCGVYVDKDGKSNWLPLSHYDEKTGAIRIVTDHLSTYAVGLHCEVSFLDTADHWAEEGIRFTTARGMFSGVGDGCFGPDRPMTRGMFVTVLGRIANATVSELEIGSFIDVDADSYCAPYVEWAKAEKIVSGVGDGAFAPERAITRQEMALIMSNFMAATGLNCKETVKSADYTDVTEITSWAVDAVQRMQTTGLLNGKEDGRFDPKGIATRGESAVMLRRFVTLLAG